jgi:DNA-directed RNA polymerase subunit M/transcription elongation factor TFIIS
MLKSVEYAGIASIPAYVALRARAQGLLLSVAKDVNVAACIEEGAAPLLMLKARPIETYEAKILALTSALAINPELAQYSALHNVASLPDNMLAPHAPIMHWAAALKEKDATQASLLEAAEHEDAQEESAFKCEKCGHQVKIVQAQTRSADEGMTIFITCKNVKCGHRTRR